MFLVSNEGKSLNRVEDLSEEEACLVKQNSVIGSASFAAKQDILKDIHGRRLWIGCDCVEPNPVVGVRNRDDFYHLFNMTKRGVHATKCPLHRLPNDVNKENEQAKIAEKKKNSFVFHYEKRSTTPSEQNKLGGTKTGVKPENSLWVCLRRIFRLAGVDTVGANLAIGEGVRKREALKAIRDMRLGGVSMAKVSRWGLGKHNDLCEAITAITESSSMPKGAAHGLLFSVIDSVHLDDNKNIMLKHGEHTVTLPRSATIEINGKQGFEFAPPYFVLYTVKNTADPDEEVIIEAQKVFITPIHSTATLIPISSELERELIDKAIGNMRYNSEKGNKIIFSRPLYPYISPLSERGVLPSLVAKSENSEMVFVDIESQVTDENRSAVERRMEAMAEITDIIKVELCDSMEEFGTKAFNAVGEAAKYVLGIGK